MVMPVLRPLFRPVARARRAARRYIHRETIEPLCETKSLQCIAQKNACTLAELRALGEAHTTFYPRTIASWWR